MGAESRTSSCRTCKSIGFPEGAVSGGHSLIQLTLRPNHYRRTIDDEASATRENAANVIGSCGCSPPAPQENQLPPSGAVYVMPSQREGDTIFHLIFLVGSARGRGRGSSPNPASARRSHGLLARPLLLGLSDESLYTSAASSP